MFRLGQKTHGPTLNDVPVAVETELSGLRLGTRIKPGETVAIACGSRRIANYPGIVKAVVDHFRRLGANPFIIPAMGSHGNGTPEGQREVLHSLGINEPSTGAEIRSSMETDIIGRVLEGVPVFCDRHALRADHIVVVSRVSLHPLLRGDVQSGLLNMTAFGLGKLDGARTYHRAMEDCSFEDLAYGIHEVMLRDGNLLAGLMIVENGHQVTARIQAALPEDFVEKESAMLRYARGLCLQLPFRFIDILLVDEVGTMFGCLGVDLNVIGRKQVVHAAGAGEFPQIRTVVYRDLNPASHGNAAGIGHADFVRSRLLGKIDTNATRLTSLAVGMPAVGAVPIDFETDREILDAALTLTAPNLSVKARIVWIRNTSSVVEFECSEPYLDEVQHWNDLCQLSGLRPLDFDSHGNLRDFVTDCRTGSNSEEQG